MVLPCPRRVVSLELVIMCWSQSCRSGSYCSFLIVEHTTTLGEMIALCRHVHSGHIRLAASGAGTEESLLGCLYLPVGMLFSSGDFFLLELPLVGRRKYSEWPNSSVYCHPLPALLVFFFLFLLALSLFLPAFIITYFNMSSTTADFPPR